ncbi:MAG: hypothetical protein ACP5QR_05150 [Rhizomicrobium sp.]
MTQWFRAYSESLNDPKIQTLPLEAFKAWHNALYLAASIDSKNGNIGTIESVSFAFRETKSTVSSAFHHLIERGLIVTDGETFRIVSWVKRQYKSDTSTDRVRRYRKRSRNVTETAPDTDTDTDTERKKDISSEVVKVGVPEPAQNEAPPRPKATAVKVEFEAWYSAYPRHEARGDAFKAYAAARAKVPPDQLLAAAQKFAEKRRGQDPKFTPLPATWLRAERWADEAAGPSGAPVAIDWPVNDDGWVRRLEIRQSRGTWLPKWGPEPGKSGCVVPPAVLARFRPSTHSEAAA